MSGDDKGYAFECFGRRYLTRWKEDQCRAFLSRRNAFDTYEYSFDGEKGRIIFRWKQQSRQTGYRDLRIGYRMTFARSEKGTLIELTCLEDDRYPRAITDTDLDEFFGRKLDAVPVR